MGANSSKSSTSFTEQQAGRLLRKDSFATIVEEELEDYLNTLLQDEDESDRDLDLDSYCEEDGKSCSSADSCLARMSATKLDEIEKELKLLRRSQDACK